MEYSHLQFSHPLLLWSLATLPLIWLLFGLFYKKTSPLEKLEAFIDPHLMKYLLIHRGGRIFSVWKTLIIWSLVWALLTIALAGPRWSYREIETFTPDQNLIILLDLSQSMDADDVKPSRLVRAKQKIEDVLNQSKGVQVGLVAFAADPHMITPLTQDTKTIKYLLPSLNTNLVQVQGSRLGPALEMAENMFSMAPGENKAVLVISDGGFEDSSALKVAKEMSDKDIKIYAMGVGTSTGAPVRDKQGNFIKKRGSPVISKLEIDKLQELSQAGGGRYLQANLAGNDEMALLNDLKSKATKMQQLKKKTRIWDDEFYWFIIPAMPFVLLWIRRGHIIPLILFTLLPSFGLHAANINQYFMNSQQQGVQALEEEDYEKANQHFDDPYRKGVVQYRAGHYAEAEKLFRESTRPEVEMNAEYNTGNALVFQNKLEEAVKQYEKVLEKWPDNQKARDNLEIVKKMLEQKEKEKQENQESGNSDQNKSNDKKEQGKQDKQSDDKDGSNKDQQSEEQKDSGDNQSDEQKESGDQEKESQQRQDQKGSGQQDKNGQDKKPGEEHPDETSNQGGEKHEEPRNSEDKPQSGEGRLKEEQERDQGSPKEQPQYGEDEQNEEERQPSPQDEQAGVNPEQETGKDEKSQEDRDADQWLNRMNQDPTEFLKNKFYIESLRKGTKEAVDPW